MSSQALFFLRTLSPFLPTNPKLDPVDTTHKTYLPTIFHIWKLVNCSLYHDVCAIRLIADIAIDALESTLMDFDEYGIFTKEQVYFMFTNFLRVLEISVSQGGSPYVFSEQDLSSRKSSEKSKTVYDISKLIVFSMAGEKCLKPNGIMEQLENFIHSIETFFHPSNNGSWSYAITALIEMLASNMVFRINTEKSGVVIIPEDRKLTQKVRDRFVIALRTVALMSIHSKSNTAVQSALSCIQSLAIISPDLILPFVLKEIYPSLQGVVETHRTMSSLKVLSILTRIITQQPRYAIHLTTLLTLSLPGIDANDLNKTFQALTFIQAAALNAPFWDLSGDDQGSLAMQYISNDVAYLEQLALVDSDSVSNEDTEMTGEDEFKMTVTNLPDYEPELLEMIWKSSTYMFREFIIDFIQRIFTLLENLPDPSSNRHRASQESNVIMLLSPTFSAVMASLPPDLYETVLTKLLDFISNNVYYSATDAIALICSTVVKDNPEYAFKRIFPILKANIETEILENGAGSTRSGTEILPRDRTLIWYLSILNMSLSSAYGEVLKFQDEILELTLFLRDHTKGSIIFHVSNTIHHALISLSLTMVRDFGIIPKRFEKIAGKDVTLKNWGEKLDPQKLDFEWYSISREGVEYSYKLYKAHVDKSIKNINEIISSQSNNPDSLTEVSDVLSSNITYIRTATSGMSMLLDPHFRDYYSNEFAVNKENLAADQVNAEFIKGESSGEDDPVDADADAEDEFEAMSEMSMSGDEEEEEILIDERSAEDDGEADFDDDGIDLKKLREYSTGYFFDNNRNDPLYIQIHKLHIEVAHFLHEVHSYMTKNRENDIAAFKALLFAYKVWFADVGIERTAKIGESFTNAYDFESGKYRIDGLKKEYPRPILAKRATLYHYTRIYHNCGPKKFTEIDKLLITDVLTTSVSIYPDICRTAQSSLESAVKGLLKSRGHIVDWIVADVLKSLDAGDLQRAESGMRVMALRILQSHIRKAFLNGDKFLNIVIKALKSDKHTLSSLAQSLLETFSQSMGINVTFNILDKNVLETIKPSQDVSQEITKRRERHKIKLKAYVAKIPDHDKELVKYLQEPHWKTLLFALEFTHSFLGNLDPDFECSHELVLKLNELSFNTHPHIRQVAAQCLQLHLSCIFTMASNGYDLRRAIDTESLRQNRYRIPTTSPDFVEKYLAERTLSNPPSYYLDDTKPGWLVFGKEIVVTSTDKPDIIKLSDRDNACLKALGAHIDREWFEKVIVLSSEEKSSHEDLFHPRVVYYFLVMFRLVAQNLTKLTFDDIFELLKEKFDPTDKNSHRCAAEFTGALVVTSIILPKESREKLVNFSVSFFIDVVSNHLFRDVLPYWRGFILGVFTSADYRRTPELLKFLYDFRVDKSSASVFKQTSRITLFQSSIYSIGWTHPAPDEIVDHYWSNIDYPKKAVCTEIGKTLSDLYNNEFYFTYPSVDKFLELNAKSESGLGIECYQMSEKYEKIIREAFARLNAARISRQDNLRKGSTDDYLSMATTLIEFLLDLVSWSTCVSLIPLLPTEIIPSTLHLFTLSEEPDLGKSAVDFFRKLGNLVCPSQYLQFMIDSNANILRSVTHWHQRLAMLAYIQTFFFRQLFEMSSKQRLQFIEVSAEMLNDSQLEVRNSAAETLSGMIRCSPAKEQAAIIKKLHVKFKKILEDNKPIKRTSYKFKPGDQSVPGSGTATPSSEIQQISIKRHAAVLGLGALVTAFPYKSPPPEWVPQILATLASVASEPGMTGKSVKSLLGSFKNTRTDTWHIDSKVFTTEQLEDLEGVLWKSYFV